MEPRTWEEAAPMEEVEFTYSNMASFLSGMGVGPFATEGRKNARLHAGAGRWDDPLGTDPLRTDVASAESRAAGTGKISRRETAFEPTAGVLVTDDDFDCATFLSVRHQDASYGQLKAGLSTLTSSINDHKRLLKSLVLQHFDQFLRCKDCIDSLHEGLQDQGSSHVDHVKDLYEDLEESGEKLYKPLLDARRDTEKTRSGLNVLRRFRFLFEIPATIKSNMLAKDYDKVVKDYRRAKLLVSQSQRSVYKRVWQEVESIVADFRAGLIQTLSDEAEISWERHLPLVRCLVALDCPVNPVGQLFRARQGYLQNLLDEAYQTLQSRIDVATEQEWDRATSLHVYDVQDRGENVDLIDEAARAKIRQNCAAELSGEFLHKMSDIMTDCVPPLCDAANRLADLSAQHNGGLHRERVHLPVLSSDDDSDSSEPGDDDAGRVLSVQSTDAVAGCATNQQVGELLRVAMVVYCGHITSVLGTDASWWQRDVLVALRGCRDCLQEAAYRFNVPWRYFCDITHLDCRVSWQFIQARWIKTIDSVAGIAAQRCLGEAAGLMQSDQIADKSVPASFGSTDDFIDSAGSWRSTSEIGMSDTIAAFENTMQQAFADLKVACHNISAVEESSLTRLQCFMHGAMFEAFVGFADCVHHAAFSLSGKQENAKVPSDAFGPEHLENPLLL